MTGFNIIYLLMLLYATSHSVTGNPVPQDLNSAPEVTNPSLDLNPTPEVTNPPLDLNPAPDPPCDDISKYSSDWFLANTKPEWKDKSIASNALFYTAGLSATARKFAKKDGNNLVTIWEIWPCNNYWIKQTRSNPLRCIMSNKDTELKYFENMSRAFAMKAATFATVMHRLLSNPPTKSIWGRVEFPTLKKADNPGGRVDTLVATNRDGSQEQLEWQRRASKRTAQETYADVVERSSDGYAWKDAGSASDFPYCFSEDEYAEMYGHFEDNW